LLMHASEKLVDKTRLTSPNFRHDNSWRSSPAVKKSLSTLEIY